MEINIIMYIIPLLIFLSLSVFFSSAETAFIGMQKIKLKHMETSGVADAVRASKIMESPERFLSTVLTGNNIANSVVAILGTVLIVTLLGEPVGTVAAVVIITLVTLIFAEVIPKSYAANHAEHLALLYVHPIEIASRLFTPIVKLLMWITSRFNGGKMTSATSALLTEDELRTAISLGEKEGVVDEIEAEMLHKIFKFGDCQVKEVMTPRTEVVWLEHNITLADFLSQFSQTTYSRFPIYQENTDNIVGVLSIKDMLLAIAKGSLTSESKLEDLFRSPLFVPETKPVGQLFGEMQVSGDQIAIVVDEFGGTAGLVTLEQLLEVIVGEIGDELARATKDFETIDEHTFQVDGSMRIEEINEELGLELPAGDGDYETIAGFVLSLTGYIPAEGEQIRYGNLKLVIMEMRDRKIEKILVTKEQKENATSTS